jgi:Arc/MetJ family transcription regulator
MSWMIQAGTSSMPPCSERLALAAKELGTTTKKDTVNAALEFVAGRRRRIEQLLDDPYALGVGPDIADAEVMRTARR